MKLGEANKSWGRLVKAGGGSLLPVEDICWGQGAFMLGAEGGKVGRSLPLLKLGYYCIMFLYV